MNSICCPICKLVFTGQGDETMFATKCGHIFHHPCIIQWMQRSKTCPCCRTNLTKTSIFKLNPSYDGEVPQQPGHEDWERENVEFQLSMKEVEMQQMKETVKTTSEQNKGLKLEVKKLDDELRAERQLQIKLREEIATLIKQLGTGALQNSRISNQSTITELIDLDDLPDPLNATRRFNPNETINLIDMDDLSHDSTINAPYSREQKDLKDVLLNSAYSRINQLEETNASILAQIDALVEELKRFQQVNCNLQERVSAYEKCNGA